MSTMHRRLSGAVVVHMCLALLWLAAATAPAAAQSALAEQSANLRVATEELRFRSQMGEIDAQQLRGGNAQIATATRELRAQIVRLPRDQQAQITQEAESLFQTRIVPLREQWRQALLQKQQADRARDDARRVEMTSDAQAAGRLQAQRALLGEAQQRGEIPAADFARTDQAAEQQLLALQQKYAGYGGNWPRAFSQALAAAARTETANLRVEMRVADTDSEIGRDAHRAAELTLAMQRNEVFRRQGALTAAEEQTLNATAQAVLGTIRGKYASGAAATDFRDRVNRLVQAGAAEQRPQWERAAQATVQAASAERAAATAATVAMPVAGSRAALAAPVTTSAPAASAAPRPPAASGGAPGAAAAPPPPPPTEPVVATQIITADEGSSWTTVLLLLLVGGGGAAGFVAFRKRQAAAPPAFTNVPVPQPPAVAHVAHARPAAAAASASVATAATAPAEGGIKAQLFAEQKQKYQARYSDALDEVTAASMAVGQMAPVVEATRRNLELLSKSVQARVSILLARSVGSPVKLLARAAVFMPLWALFRRVGWLVRIALGVGVWVGVQTAAALVVEGDAGVLIILYAIAVVALFFVERYRQLQVPRKALKAASEQFRNVRLAYVYTGQQAEATPNGAVYHAVRVSAQERTGPGQEITVPAGKEATAGPGAYLLAIGSLATFRLDRNGSATMLSKASGDEFMSNHGDLLTEALGEQQAFADSTLPPLAQYGQAMWQKRQAERELPRLEALVRDVERLEDVWRDTYVADDVFEFLFRAIDMFNMRDTATPPGLLLFGGAGNGKKHLAKKVAESLSATFEQITPARLATADEISSLWEGSRGGNPVVLFVPNAESLFPRPEGGAGSSERTLEWLAEWEKHEPRDSRVWVVMTARSDQGIDEGIVHHIGQDSTIEIKPPDAEGRTLIFHLACVQHRIADPPASILRATGGASVQELRRTAMAAKRASSPGQPQESHWQAAIRTVRGADARLVDETKTWDRLVLPPAIKQQLQAACKILQDAQEYIKRGAKVPNFLLYGPPGTGKTEIARTIANESGVNFMSATTSDIKAGYVGQSAQLVRALFEKARASAPTVLFIDEIESVAARRGSKLADQFTQDIVTEMLAQMDGAAKSQDRPVFVLGATNLRQEIDDAILSRFTSSIEIPVPDEQGRADILVRLLADQTLEPGLDAAGIASVLAKRTNGLSGRDLVKLVDRAVQQSVLTAATPDDVRITRELLEAQVAHLAESRSDAADTSARWESLVLPDETLAKLRQMAEALRHMETLQRQGIEPPRGAILFGPPGTGKTQIARTLRNESGVPVLFAGPSDLKAGYVGQSAIKVKELFDRARSQAPCILFIDEIETGAAARGSDKADSFTEEIVTEMLSQMDGAKKNTRPVFVLAATNHLERVDSAVLSRFTYKIEIPNPSPAQRKQLFAVFLNKYPHEPFDADAVAGELASRAGNIGGRDIQSLVVRASQAAAQRAILAGTPDNVVMTRDDLLAQLAPQGGREVSAAEIEQAWSQVVLKPEVKASILSKLRMFSRADKAAPRGLLLYGPPGTGKTEIARRLAASAGCEFLSLTASDLKGAYVGQSGKQVKAAWDKARSYARCIMFVDECEGVFGRRGGANTDSFSEEVVREFLAMWDGVGSKGQVWVVGATNRRDQLDEAIVSRFGAAVEIGLPDAAERVQILQLEMHKFERDLQVPEFVGKATSGMAGRDLSQLARDVCLLAEEHGGTVTPDQWREVIGRHAKATSDAVDDRARWESLILPEATIRTLKRLCEMLKHAETLGQQGIDVPRGALLHGPPGTGKTQIARTLANESGLAFVAAGPADMKAGFVGQSALKVRELFERARGKAPAILFIDEIESAAASRDGGKGDQFTGDIVTELLTQMDGVKKNTRPVFVLAATNHPRQVDGAVLSRFEEQIEIPNPGFDERRRMLVTFLARQRTAFDVEEAAAQLAAATDGMSGRDLQSVVRRATQLALQRALDAGTPDRVEMQRQDLAGQFEGRGV